MLAGAALGGGWEARHRLHQWYMQETGACVAGPSPPGAHVRIVAGSLRSSSVPGPVGYVVALPQPERPPASTPVVFCLPGRATTATGVLDLGLPGFAAQAAGGAAPALVGVDSGESYWHPRRSGEDRMAMLIHDLLPMIERRFGLGPGGRSILGWSMGGYGALLAAALHPGLFSGVAALSPAVWGSAAEQHAAVPDAFDSAADYRRYDVFRLAPRLARTPVFIACGNSDPFDAADRALAARLHPRPHTLFQAGCHDDGFWRLAAGPALRFLAAGR